MTDIKNKVDEIIKRISSGEFDRPDFSTFIQEFEESRKDRSLPYRD